MLTTCTCTVYHHCPIAAEMWKHISEKLWKKYHAAPKMYHDEYYQATAAYLAHRDGKAIEVEHVERDSLNPGSTAD